MYEISKRSFKIAKQYGLEIFPSSKKNKKIDVFKNGIKIASIGAIGYKDYSIHLAENGIQYANERRRLYRIRHQNDRTKTGTAGYYADKILW